MGIAVKGTTLTFGTQAITLELLSVDGIGEEVGDLDMTHIGSSNTVHESNNVINTPEATFGVLFDETLALTVGAALETITVDFAGSGKTRSAEGYIKSYSPTGSLGDRFTADVVVQFSGAVNKVLV